MPVNASPTDPSKRLFPQAAADTQKRGHDPLDILLAEDEIRMGRALQELLLLEGCQVELVSDGASALAALIRRPYDVAVLDVMMPEMNGFDVVREIRSRGIGTPVLLLTAKGELEDKVTGLDAGADDYLTKPFLSKELLARLRALSRRNPILKSELLTFGDLSLDPSAAALSCLSTGRSVRLSEKELKLMEYLLSNQGHILTREQLALRIWGYDNDAEYNNVEVYLSFTRKKLSYIGSETEIKAVRGIGYELRSSHVS